MSNYQNDFGSNSKIRSNRWDVKDEQARNSLNTIEPVIAVCLLCLIGLVCVGIDYYLKNK